MPAIPTPPKRSFRTTEAFRPAHWVSAKTPMREDDITGAQRALADVGHYRPWPDLGFQPVAERRLFEGLKAFQKANGLEPDGVMGPAGPTAQTLDAARHAKATAGARRPARDVLGRGANLPLDLAVGEGGANREADVKAAKAALALLGYYPAEKALRPDGRTGKADGHDFEFGLGAFQRRFGLQPDRRMEPFGPTQAKLDELLQPALDRAFGFDIENPASGRAAVEPLLISADPDAEPQTRAKMLEALRAHGLAHMAETRRTDALYGFEADDALNAGAGEDRLEDDPEAAGPAGEDEDAARPEAAEHGDADEAAAVSGATGEADLDRVHRMLASTPFARAAENTERLSEITAQERRIVGSYTTEQIEDRLRRLTLHTRRSVQDPFGPDLDSMKASDGLDYRRRVLAQADILKQRYLDADPDLSATEANQRVLARIGEGMGLRPRDLRLLLDFVPVAGDALAIHDGILALWHAANADTAEERLQHLSDASLAMVGLVPIIGDPIKLSLKVRLNLRKLGVPDEEHEEFIRRQAVFLVTTEMISKYRMKGKALSVFEMAKKNPALATLPRQELTRIQNTLNPISGRKGQEVVAALFELGDLATDSARRTLPLAFQNRAGIVRIFDTMRMRDIVPSTRKGMFEIVDRVKGVAGDVKSGRAKPSPNQKKFDDSIGDAENEIMPLRATDLEIEISSSEIIRAPIHIIPRDRLEHKIRAVLERKGYSREVVAAVVEGVGTIHELDRNTSVIITLESAVEAALVAAEGLSL